jgi:hypothetical protein
MDFSNAHANKSEQKSVQMFRKLRTLTQKFCVLINTNYIIIM